MSDFESTIGSLCLAIVVIGTDVPIYVTEVHTSGRCIGESDCSVEIVACVTPVNSLAVRSDGGDSAVCECTVSVVIRVGTVPICVNAGNAYVTVY